MTDNTKAIVIAIPIILLLLALFFGTGVLIATVFSMIAPEQYSIFSRLVGENMFVCFLLLFSVYPIGWIFDFHKVRHRRHLNKLAEIEWVEQYGDDGMLMPKEY